MFEGAVTLSVFLTILTFDRIKEVEERVVGDLLGNGTDSTAAFMLLLLLNSFHCNVFPFEPIYLTAGESRYKKRVRKNS